MNYGKMAVLYLLLLISYLVVYAVIRKENKAWRYTIVAIYLATGGLFTFMLVDEIISPSVDANIGFGGAILLMETVSIAGIIVAFIMAVVRYLVRRK